MSNSKLTKVASAVRGSFDRRTAGGIVIGVALMMSAMAVAQSGGNAGWFAGLGLGATNTANSTTALLLSQQEGVISQTMKDGVINCSKDGIGLAIENAQKVHLKLASAGPNVESLFDINGDCFSSINQIFDLSFAIPSLASILSAAQDAVLKYAQKKVCTAVNKVSSMVTDPLNKAITDINGMAGFADINGMTNQFMQGQMAGIDPQLGSEYHPTVQTGTYTTNTNAFNTSQTTFNPNSGDQSGQINGDVATINALIQQIGNLMIAINTDNQAVASAQNQLNWCNNNNNWNDCSAQQDALTAAQQKLAADQAALAQAQQQLASAVQTGGSNNIGMQAAPMAPASLAGSQNTLQAASTAPKNFWSKVTGLFN